MFLNIDDDLKKELQEEAKQKGLSLTAYIRMILIERNKISKNSLFLDLNKE